MAPSSSVSLPPVCHGEITGPADLALLFSLLHDGVITEAVRDGDDLALRVEIRYLTQRIAPSFTCFRVRLRGVADLAFDPWPKAADAAPETWRDVSRIFAPPLDILEGAAAGDGLAVHCNQSAREASHCGGTLRLRAAGASVTDEADARYDLAALRALADGYWDDWRAPRSPRRADLVAQSPARSTVTARPRSRKAARGGRPRSPGGGSLLCERGSLGCAFVLHSFSSRPS